MIYSTTAMLSNLSKRIFWSLIQAAPLIWSRLNLIPNVTTVIFGEVEKNKAWLNSVSLFIEITWTHTLFLLLESRIINFRVFFIEETLYIRKNRRIRLRTFINPFLDVTSSKNFLLSCLTSVFLFRWSKKIKLLSFDR